MTDILSGHYTLTWDASAQLPANTYNNNFRARLVATAGGVPMSGVSSPITIDLRGLQGGLAVSGRVKDANSGAALGGATVMLAGQNVTTASDGRYSLANVALVNGNTLNASKAGYATYSGMVPVPAGGVQSVARDINLPLVSGDRPVVTSIRSAIDGIFIETVPILNEYTAVVDWRGATPQNVEFYVNGTLKQTVPTATTEAKATLINMGQMFTGSYHLGANKLSAVAVSDAGRSLPYDLAVTVIPKPSFVPLLTGIQTLSYNNPRLAIEFYSAGGSTSGQYFTNSRHADPVWVFSFRERTIGLCPSIRSNGSEIRRWAKTDPRPRGSV